MKKYLMGVNQSRAEQEPAEGGTEEKHPAYSHGAAARFEDIS